MGAENLEVRVDGFEHLSDDELLAVKRSHYSDYPEDTTTNRLRFFFILNEMRRRDKPHTKQAGYVYLMCDEQGIYKIGLSMNPEQRAKHLVQNVEIVCEIKTPNMVALEQSLHGLFIGKRVSRGSQHEWFTLEPADVAYIKSLAVRS